jgi:DNA-binding NarL/FixJ family response regulator
MSRRQVSDHPHGDETLTTLLLADDHAVVRLGLRRLLEGEPGLDVIGEVGDGLELLSAVERLRPEVLLLDLMMPGLSGLEALRQVRKRYPKIRVVVLSMHASEAYVFEALRNGAAAYVLKGSGGSEVKEAVRAVIAGRRYLSPPLSERAIQSYVEKADGGVRDAYDTLSGREREVLQLAAEGHNNSEIAARLFISRRTVESHRAKLFDKLGLHSQTDLVRYALRRGIIKLDE